jgi:hypothetical protein
MSLIWEGTLRQSREDDLEQAMERQDLKLMADGDNCYQVLDINYFDEAPPETPAQREYRLWNEWLDDYDFTWEELHQ